MTKEQEIQILQSLKGDTYFAQFFGEDIDTMCNNISNDFPIEMGCKFNAKREEFANRMKAVRDEHREMMHNIAEYLVETEDINGTADKLVGMMNVIKIKRKLEIKLNQDEIDFLIERAEQYK